MAVAVPVAGGAEVADLDAARVGGAELEALREGLGRTVQKQVEGDDLEVVVVTRQEGEDEGGAGVRRGPTQEAVPTHVVDALLREEVVAGLGERIAGFVHL